MALPGSWKLTTAVAKTRSNSTGNPQNWQHQNSNKPPPATFNHDPSSWAEPKRMHHPFSKQTSSQFSLLAVSTVSPSHAMVTRRTHPNFPVRFSRTTRLYILQVHSPWTNVHKDSPFSQQTEAKFWSNWNLMQVLSFTRTNRCYVHRHRSAQWNSPNLGLHHDNFVELTWKVLQTT